VGPGLYEAFLSHAVRLLLLTRKVRVIVFKPFLQNKPRINFFPTWDSSFSLTCFLMIPEMYVLLPWVLISIFNRISPTYPSLVQSTCSRQKGFPCVSSPVKGLWNQPQRFPMCHLC
jgi:hypothetical protein